MKKNWNKIDPNKYDELEQSSHDKATSMSNSEIKMSSTHGKAEGDKRPYGFIDELTEPGDLQLANKYRNITVNTSVYANNQNEDHPFR